MEEHQLIEKLGLAAHLTANPAKGQIWLDESRMVMFHARALTCLRTSMIEQLGLRRTRSMFWRLGFESGKNDARIAIKHQGEANDYDVFRIGPALHAMEGVARANIVEAEIDWQEGSFNGVVHWVDSWEAQAQIDSGIALDEEYHGACWAACGYASGYVTEYFQRLVIFLETQCACEGHSHCVVIGKPAEAWEDQGSVNYIWSSPADDEQINFEEKLRRLRREQQKPVQGPEPVKPEHIVGSSPKFIEAFNILSKAAPGNISVMLLGETGVGKEVFARWLHENSRAADGPFIAVNCSALPADLIEAELFGVRRGAYTGAVETRPGRFERANGGTLFLDEVGDLPLAAQAKLLRVLQTGEVERLGDDTPLKISVRLISATNVDLTAAMREGRFRSDLYYRLATYPIVIPALRDRPGDVSRLVEAMIARFAPLYDKRIAGVSEQARYALESYSWPGNVRELENFIERAVLLAPDGGQITLEHLPEHVAEQIGEISALHQPASSAGSAGSASALFEQLLEQGMDLEGVEHQLMCLALERSSGNIAAAAKLLGITRRQLAYRLQKANLLPEGAALE